MRRHACVVVSIVVTISSAVAATLPLHASAATCWLPPVIGRVTDPFREPPCEYCAGNRGIEYAVGRNAAVRSVAAGVVTWSGVVAGTRYVVVRHVDGWRATYGRLDATSLSTGDRVLARTIVGHASGAAYFGLRRHDDTYIDPAPYLGRLIGRPRLVPTDGTRSRPAPAPRLTCGS